MLTPDWWESARFQAVCVASSWFRQSGVASSRPPAGTPQKACGASRKPLGNHFVNVKGYNFVMAVVVSLRDMVDELQMLSHESSAYLKKSTGKVIAIRDDDIEMVRTIEESDEIEEGDEEGDSGEKDGGSSGNLDLEAEFFRDVKNVMLLDDDYLKLPSKFDIDEYEIMERFSLSFSDEKISDVLLSKIRGSGAFRRFKDTIYHYGIEEDWFRFKDEAYKEIAVSWLESHGFAYADDMNRREKSV
jgi:hypothetical protein